MVEAKKVVFFDGDCLLCSRVVRWVHRRDRREIIWFASLDSDFAAQARVELELPETMADAESFVFWEQDLAIVTTKSAATLRLLRALGGFWAGVGAAGHLCPSFLRDLGYDLVARNRRKWFRSSEKCDFADERLRKKLLS